MATTGNSGTAGGHQQSIGTTDEQAVDGIAGSHAGGQEPSGAHVDAGAEGLRQGGDAASKQAELPQGNKRIDEVAHEGVQDGLLQRGGISSEGLEPAAKNTR